MGTRFTVMHERQDTDQINLISAAAIYFCLTGTRCYNLKGNRYRSNFRPVPRTLASPLRGFIKMNSLVSGLMFCVGIEIHPLTWRVNTSGWTWGLTTWRSPIEFYQSELCEIKVCFCGLIGSLTPWEWSDADRCKSLIKHSSRVAISTPGENYPVSCCTWVSLNRGLYIVFFCLILVF